MTEPLLTIGPFARAVGLSPSALRYYDDCGLLQPATVDGSSGYRYYTPELTTRALAIVQMREIGMSIEAMRSVLDGTPAERADAVQQHVLATRERSDRAATALAQLCRRLDEPSRTPSLVATTSGPALAAALSQVLAFAAPDSDSPLAAVLLDLVDGSLDVVATDRYRMAVRTLAAQPAEGTVADSDERRIILPINDARELAASLQTEDVVDVQFDQVPSVAGRQVDEVTDPYPAHRTLLAGIEQPKTRAVLDRSALLNAVQAVNDNEIRLIVRDSEVGIEPSNTAVSATTRGPDIAMRVNRAFVMQCLTAVVGPTVDLSFAAPAAPLRISAPYQPDLILLLMPLAD